MRQFRCARCIARLKRFTSDGTRTFAAWPPLVRWLATIRPTKPGVCISDSWNCGIFCGRGKSFFNNCSPPPTASSEPSPRRIEAKKKRNSGHLLISFTKFCCLIARCENSLLLTRSYTMFKRSNPLATDSLNELNFESKGYDNSYISTGFIIR